MNIVSVSWNNLRARPMASFLSLLLLTFGVSIISLLLLLNSQLEDNFNKNVRGIDMVLGAKGSPLQLILASVYHIDNPTGNIPLAEVQKAMNNPLVEKWIPLAYGDNYKGYRILGTDHQYVDHYGASLAEGSLWKNNFEVTPGALAAERLGLKVGDEFLGAHGVVGELDIHDSHAYKVSGILQPTGTVIDQLILTNIASVWEIHEEHDENASNEPHTEESGDITAALVKFRTPMGTMMIPRKINQETSLQAALPAIEINRLFSLFAAGIQTIRAIALAIMVISGISVFVSLYSSLKDRKYELALMRTLGASRWQLFAFVMQEGEILALLGFVLGIGISRGGMLLFSLLVESEYHYRFDIGHFLPEENLLFGVTLLIGFFAALIPGIQAFNTNISETLADG
ncbi:MAG: FtsX-like permease family protein [Bacteroidia bacterium]|nr:FtsX-like permease family protein [Bacteroidia bacterium]